MPGWRLKAARSRCAPVSQPTFRIPSSRAELKASGAGSLFISHRLAEVAAIADRVTVCSDRRHVATRPAAELPQREMARLMVGREMSALCVGRTQSAVVHRRTASAPRSCTA